MTRRLSVLAATVFSMMVLLATTIDVANASLFLQRYALIQKQASSQWDGARAYMEIRNGAISDSDAAAGGHINNTLWVYTNDAQNDPRGVEWVEAGYTRGWRFTNVMTGYWASQRWSEGQNKMVYADHKITSVTMVDGSHHWFKIMHYSGTTRGEATWRVYIDGDPVVSGDGVSVTTSHEFSHATGLDAGLETVASSGVMGNSSNWCNFDSITATTDEEASWLNLNNPTLYPYPSGSDPVFGLYVAWVDYPYDMRDRCNP